MTNDTPEPISLDPISYIITVFFAFSAILMPLLRLVFIGVMSRQVGILFAFKCVGHAPSNRHVETKL